MFKSGTQTYLDKLNKFVDLGRKPKDTLVRTSTREAAEIVAENIVSEIGNRGHVSTGKLADSISIVKEGPRSYDVKGIDYAKYVNGYGAESEGTGFIDDAVDNAIADGYSGIRQLV